MSSTVPRAATSAVNEIPAVGFENIGRDKDSAAESIEVLLESSIMSGVSDVHRRHDPSTEAFRTAVMVCEVFADMIGVAIGVLLAYGIYTHLRLGTNTHYRPIQIVVGCAILCICFVLMLYKDDAYNPVDGLLRVKETERVLRASCTVSMLVLPVTFLAQLHLSRGLAVLCFLTVPALLIVEKYWLHLALRRIRIRGYGTKKVVIYGAGLTGRKVFSALVRSPKLGLSPVAFVERDQSLVGTTISALGYRKLRAVANVVAGPLTPELVRRLGAVHVIIAIPALRREEFVRTVVSLMQAGIAVSFVPNHILPLDLWMDHTDIDGLLLASFRKASRSLPYRAFKRVIDIVVSATLLFLLSPAMLTIAFLIRRGSRGPALFRQERVGKDGRRFCMYKFRSMYLETPIYEVSPSDSSDDRITSIGRILRKTSFDELPQVINVLKGEMSLVGPRPEMPFIVDRYRPVHRQRLIVKPGITGLWQLSADRDYHIHENIEYDLYYIRNQNFFMDLSILVHTAFFAMRGI